MYEQFMGDFTCRHSESGKVQLFKLREFSSDQPALFLYFSTYSGIKTLFLIPNICYEHNISV